MKTMAALLGPVLALAANVGTDDESERTFNRIERHVRSNIADNYGHQEFDVVGYADEMTDEEIIGVVRSRAAARGGYGRSPATASRALASRSPALSRSAATFPGRGGLPQMAHAAFHQGMVPGPLGMSFPPGTPSPVWFQSALGVSPPMELMNVMSLTPESNSGIFGPASGFTTIKYSARPQRPFRGERPVASPVKSAGVTTATTLVCQPIFVGVIPQAVEIGTTDIGEWAPNSFGVRLAMTDAAQGTLVSVVVSVAGTAIPAGETITLSAITIYGRALA